MTLYSTKETLSNLKKRLSDINPNTTLDLEIENLIVYPKVKRRLEKYGLKTR